MKSLSLDCQEMPPRLNALNNALNASNKSPLSKSLLYSNLYFVIFLMKSKKSENLEKKSSHLFESPFSDLRPKYKLEGRGSSYTKLASTLNFPFG
jgi:hypothetical protein